MLIVCVTAVVTLALALGLAARVVVPAVAHQAFPLSSAIVLIVAVAQVASGLMYPLNIGPYVLEQPAKQVPVFVASGILITIVGIVMVRWWGAVGGALALLLVYVVQAVLLARVSQRLYRVDFEWARLGRVVCAVGTAFLLVRVLGVLASRPLVDWLLAPLFLAIHVGVAVRPIGHAVEDARDVADVTTQHVALKLHADVAVRHERSDQRAGGRHLPDMREHRGVLSLLVQGQA